MNPYRNSEHLRELSAAIEESMQRDCPTQWRPAFAAADNKVKQTLLEQLKQKFGPDDTAVADAGGVHPDATGGSTTQVASADGSNGFANLLRGWLGRA
ncbi:MAG TPA: hypothetical protein VFG64_08240 [Dongiaceae bacterium]|nr:hypothetical protein [Dongiaceae bacterium]